MREHPLCTLRADQTLHLHPTSGPCDASPWMQDFAGGGDVGETVCTNGSWWKSKVI